MPGSPRSAGEAQRLSAAFIKLQKFAQEFAQEFAYEHNLRQNDPALDRAMWPELTRCLGKDHRGRSRRLNPSPAAPFAGNFGHGIFINDASW
jgi:hypothetical protein